MNKKKIGFVFLDEIHHLHHFISVFAELYKKDKYDVDIITFEGDNSYLLKLLNLFEISSKVIKPFSTYGYRKILNCIRKRKTPNRLFVFKKNKKNFLKYDMLIFNVPQQGFLLDSKKVPKLVYLDHGAGDREYAYNEKLLKFDLVVVAGKKVEDTCRANADFSKTNLKVCGYPKFDVVQVENKNLKLFNNSNPVILYNPHFEKKLSSYSLLGEDVLEFFYNNKEKYNLIFAPHINLFNKNNYLDKSSFNMKYLNQDNIIIDFGSVKSVNMNYTLAADVYIGDVSSQVYEFLLTPRPCIFINAYKIDWKDNAYYKNWKLGQVITHIDQLSDLLQSRDEWQPQFLEKQIEVISYAYDKIEGKTASERITDEIIKLI